jgi:hypothetical protein
MNVQNLEQADRKRRIKVYICYSHGDIEFAENLGHALTKRGFVILMDRRDVHESDWESRLEGLMRDADEVVYVVSPDSMKSNVGLAELLRAQALSKRVVLVDCRPVSDDMLPPSMASAPRLSLAPEAIEGSGFEQLVQSLQRDAEWIQQHTDFGQMAHQWDRRSRQSDLLLRGIQLTEAEAWLRSRPETAPPPSKMQREYVAASRLAQSEVGARGMLFRRRGQAKIRPQSRPLGSKIFISYRRSDTPHLAGRVYDKLCAEFPAEQIFFDVDTIPFGVNFKQHIGAALSETAVVLAIVGVSWMPKTRNRVRLGSWDRKEDFVLSEMEVALDLGVPIMPLLADGASMPQGSELPRTIKDLSDLNAATIRAGRDFHKDMVTVLGRVQSWREQAMHA